MRHLVWFGPALFSSLALGCGDSAPSERPHAPTAVPTTPTTSEPVTESAAICPEGVTFTDLAGKVGVKMKVNGTGPYTFFFDTGASITSFGRALEKEAASATLETAGVTKTLERVPITDMENFKLPVDGVLGMDFIGEQVVTIDYPRQKWWITDTRDERALRACGHLEGKPEEVPYLRWNYFFIKGGIESLDGWLLLDSGASLGGTFDSTFEELDAARKRPSLPGFYTPSGIGTFWARLTTLGSIRFGSHSIGTVLTRTIDDGMIPAPRFPDRGKFLGLFPSDMLRLFMVTIDPATKTVRFDGAKGVERVGSQKFYVTGIGLSDSLETHAIVSEVLPGSAAAEQGVLPGDEVVSIAGRLVEKLDPYSRSWGLASSTLGAKVRVVVKHEATTRTLELETRDLLLPPK